MRERVATRGRAVAILLLIAAPAVLAAERVPARVLQARYVALGYDLGDRFLSASDAIGNPDRITPEDRRALDAVRDLIEQWDRYVVTPRPDSAELLIAVRVGRRMQASGVRIGGRGDRTGPSGGGYAVELSSRGDMLSVYERSGGGLGALLWRAQRLDGFNGPAPTLADQFKAAVEDAARKP